MIVRGKVYTGLYLGMSNGYACLGNGSNAPSLGRVVVDGSPVPLGSTATHDPIRVPKPVWERWNPLGETITYMK